MNYQSPTIIDSMDILAIFLSTSKKHLEKFKKLNMYKSFTPG